MNVVRIELRYLCHRTLWNNVSPNSHNIIFFVDKVVFVGQKVYFFKISMVANGLLKAPWIIMFLRECSYADSYCRNEEIVFDAV